jgi:hypothetical protein
MNNYLWWPITTILLCIGCAICSYKSSTQGSSLWFMGVVILGGCFGLLYATVTKYSTNLILDNTIYNAIIALTVTGVFIWFGCSKSFEWEQWVGVGMMLSGLILFNVRM